MSILQLPSLPNRATAPWVVMDQDCDRPSLRCLKCGEEVVMERGALSLVLAKSARFFGTHRGCRRGSRG